MNQPIDFPTDNEFADLLYQYSLKKGERATSLEGEQLYFLCCFYGYVAVSVVVQHLKQIDVSSVGRALMQIGGFCEVIPKELAGILITKAEAKKRFNPEQIRIAERFEKLVILLSDVDQIEQYVREYNDTSPHQIWEDYIGESITPDERHAINVAIKQYGLPLATKAVHVAAKKDISKEERIKIFQSWLEAASERDFSALESIMRKAGRLDSSITWSLPFACPFIVSSYYEAKTNKEISESDMSLLKTMVENSSEEEVIFSISSIPAAQFSADKLATEHYTKIGKFSELVYYLIEKEKVAGSYFCTDCNHQLFETSSSYLSSSDHNACPECSSRKLETHSLDEPLPNIDKDLMRKFQEEDPMFYSLLFISVASEYCPNCGRHFFIGENTYSELSKSPPEDIDGF